MTFTFVLTTTLLVVWALAGLQACTTFGKEEISRRTTYIWCRLLTVILSAVAIFVGRTDDTDTDTLGILVLSAMACMLVGESLMAQKFLRSWFKDKDSAPVEDPSNLGRRSGGDLSKDDFTTV